MDSYFDGPLISFEEEKGMVRLPSVIFLLALGTTLYLQGSYAGRLLYVGVPKVDRSTVTSLGVQLPITGDNNLNAIVSVQFRICGTTTWQKALPLVRVRSTAVKGHHVASLLVGSIVDLKPGTTYEVQLHAVDPDGVDQILNIIGSTCAVQFGSIPSPMRKGEPGLGVQPSAVI